MLDFNNANRETQDYPFGPSGAEAVFNINNKTTNNKIEEFANLIGCDNVIRDGKLHRYGHKLTKWYVLHDGATFAAGAYGDWRDDQQSSTWCSRKKDEMSASEWKNCQNRIEQAKTKREAEQAAEYAQAALVAKETWAKCKKADFVHKYLDDKQVKAYGIGWGTVARNPASLVIPVYNPDGEIVSIQSISSAGNKLFLSGGRKKGCFHKIQGNGTTFICEGYATGATIHEATGATVVIAFDAGNIPPVAKHFPAAIVACDNDQYKPNLGNAGVEAGKKSGLKYVIPQFKDLSTQPSDFNDLAALEGLQAVRKQLAPHDKKPTVTSWAEAILRPVERKPIITGILDETEHLMIVGQGGVGKSFLGMQVLFELAMEEKRLGGVNALFGKFEIPKPRRCLLVQAENGEASFITRMRRMVEYEPLYQSSLNNIFSFGLDGGVQVVGQYLNDETFQQTLKKQIEDNKIEVVLLDPLISFHTENENDNGAMRKVLDTMVQIKLETNVTFIVVHHAGKVGGGKTTGIDAVRGASAINQWTSNVWVLDELDADTVQLSIPKLRDFKKPGDLYFKRTDGLTFEAIENPNRTKEDKQMDIVIEALKELGGEAESQRELAEKLLDWEEELGSSSTKTFNRYIQKAIEKGLILVQGGGLGQKKGLILGEILNKQ